jgi:hypothetical protein
MATLHFRSSQPLIPATPAGGRQVKKGTFFSPNFVQLGKQSAQKLFAKAGSHSASKFESLAFIETHKQRVGGSSHVLVLSTCIRRFKGW